MTRLAAGYRAVVLESGIGVPMALEAKAVKSGLSALLEVCARAAMT